MTQRGTLTRAIAPATKPSQRLRDRQLAKTRALAGRRLSDFLPLGPAEQLLLDCCRTGEMARVARQRPETPEVNNRIRASFLRFLLLGGDEQAPVHERGVQLFGCWVDGRLDLGGCVIPFNAALKHSHFANLLFAQDARLGGLLSLEGSCLSRGMNADRLQVNGSVFLRGGFNAKHEVRLLGAQIGGNLSCKGGQFEVKKGDSLLADSAVVKGSVLLGEDFRATGEVRLLGAQIGGSLSCSGGQFEVKEGDALSADGATVKGSVFLGEGFRATGKFRLLGAQIGGDLFCKGGQFEVKDGGALSADGATVKGRVFLGEGFRATGEVRLLGAQIGGSLSCRGGQFEVKDGGALSADRAVVKGSVFLGDGFRATGDVRLLGAQIGGNLSCSGGQFEVKEGDSLSADGATVKGSVFLGKGFRATGDVRLLGAQISSNLSCKGGQFKTLSADGAVVKGGFFLQDVRSATRLNLSHAEVGVLVDDTAAWASGSVLDGFRYGAFGGSAPTSGTERLEWLLKQSEQDLGEDFRPQPWRQLQRVLREMGHYEDAKQIGIAFEKRLRAIGRIGQSPPTTNPLVAKIRRAIAEGAHFCFGLLVGYGFRPMRLLAWMVGVWLVFGALFWWLALPPNGALAPSDPLVFHHPAYEECLPDRSPTPGNWFLCAPLRGEYATFSPLAFSLDVLLPLVDLGQEKYWGAFVPTPKSAVIEEIGSWSNGHWVRLLIWFETLFGWVCSLLLVAIVSGLARRSEEG